MAEKEIMRPEQVYSLTGALEALFVCYQLCGYKIGESNVENLGIACTVSARINEAGALKFEAELFSPDSLALAQKFFQGTNPVITDEDIPF